MQMQMQKQKQPWEQEGEEADADQQDLEPPDIMEVPVLLPFQSYFRDVDIVTHN